MISDINASSSVRQPTPSSTPCPAVSGDRCHCLGDGHGLVVGCLPFSAADTGQQQMRLSFLWWQHLTIWDLLLMLHWCSMQATQTRSDGLASLTQGDWAKPVLLHVATYKQVTHLHCPLVLQHTLTAFGTPSTKKGVLVITPCSIWSRLVSSRSSSWSGGISRWSGHCSPHPTSLYSHALGIPERLRDRAFWVTTARCCNL